MEAFEQRETGRRLEENSEQGNKESCSDFDALIHVRYTIYVCVVNPFPVMVACHTPNKKLKKT